MTWKQCLGLVVLASVGCGGDAPSEPARGMRSDDVRSSKQSSSDGDRGGVDLLDAGMSNRSQSADAGPSQGGRSSSGSAASMDAGKPRESARDAGRADAGARSSGNQRDGGSPRKEPDAGRTPDDAGAAREDASSGEQDAGAAMTTNMNTGSCCSTSDQPGCGDADLQACVCAQRESCCTEAWDDACTRIVAEKFCQSGVRDCVCGSAEDQWQQSECCESSWDDTCDSVATNKCGATPDCR